MVPMKGVGMRLALFAVLSLVMLSPQSADARLLKSLSDQCKAKCIEVQATVGKTKVCQGERVGFSIIARRFQWWCGGLKKWTTCARRTNYVLIAKDTKTRRHIIHCFRR
ncbi:MAG: hypothetical protein MRY74_06345 [Neomegalonema sp.]|nr:hypothetical protein [Neomegalonema sp.]